MLLYMLPLRGFDQTGKTPPFLDLWIPVSSVGNVGASGPPIRSDATQNVSGHTLTFTKTLAIIELSGVRTSICANTASGPAKGYKQG